MEQLKISPHYLSDNSEVFSVHFGDVELHAVTEKDAYLLAEKIKSAVDQHALNQIVIKSF